VQLKRLAGTMKAPKEVPQPYLSWGTEKDFSGGAAAKSIQARFSRGHTTEWRYRGGKYVNTNSNAAAGKDFRPDTVIVVRVRRATPATSTRPATGCPRRSTRARARRSSSTAARRCAAPGRSRARPGALVLKTRAGKMKIPAGHTWIELLPRNGAGGHLSFQG
jgi:hypothetical protein